jgi:predicted glycogen debranching enzyme
MSRNGKESDLRILLNREWLVANGLGGFASSSISGLNTRKYHGMLVAALPSPLGRVVMLNTLFEELRFPDGSTAQLAGEVRNDGVMEIPGAEFLREFRLEAGLSVWRYEIRGFVIEKRVLTPHLQNTVYVNYRLISGDGPVRLRLRPFMNFRQQEAEVSSDLRVDYKIRAIGDRYEIEGDNPSIPVLRMFMYGKDRSFILSGGSFKDHFYRVEHDRCNASHGNLWNPGYFRVNLTETEDATLVASTEAWDIIHALRPHEAFTSEMQRRQRLLAAAHPEVQTGPAAELVLTADSFIIAPTTRVADAARAHAAGGDVRSVIAGYHWFTDWGRDTMISLDGLTLATGRFAEASYILRTFAHYIRDGLIPNMFPEGKADGLYHTSDATLWFFHAISRYLDVTGDVTTLQQLLPRLVDIVNHHVRGTRFNIGIDPEDGLLKQGAIGYQLTWMDAKVGDWVVTPRRGKPVEINALWYNALRLLSGWLRSECCEEEARPISELADRVYESFNRRFWYDAEGYLYDVIDGEQGDDAAFRPNQLFAISLAHPVLDSSRWERVVEMVRERLLTPFGLRSLSSGHKDYKMRYQGDLCTRDAAYHQGTVWAWLIGPFIDAWIRVHPEDRSNARQFLQGLISHLDEACLGSISEVFDAEPPFEPGGCISQAWSVAEVLRCWVKTGTTERGSTRDATASKRICTLAADWVRNGS